MGRFWGDHLINNCLSTSESYGGFKASVSLVRLPGQESLRTPKLLKEVQVSLSPLLVARLRQDRTTLWGDSRRQTGHSTGLVGEAALHEKKVYGDGTVFKTIVAVYIAAHNHPIHLPILLSLLSLSPVSKWSVYVDTRPWREQEIFCSETNLVE